MWDDESDREKSGLVSFLFSLQKEQQRIFYSWYFHLWCWWWRWWVRTQRFFRLLRFLSRLAFLTLALEEKMVCTKKTGKSMLTIEQIFLRLPFLFNLLRSKKQEWKIVWVTQRKIIHKENEEIESVGKIKDKKTLVRLNGNLTFFYTWKQSFCSTQYFFLFLLRINVRVT